MVKVRSWALAQRSLAYANYKPNDYFPLTCSQISKLVSNQSLTP